MRISRDLIYREIAGEHILVPTGELALHRSGVFVINELGAEIWTMLTDGKDRAAIIACLLEEYDVTEDVLTKDVDEFLRILKEENFLTD